MMRILSAFSFVISVIGLLLAIYLLVGIVPNMKSILQDVNLKETEFLKINRENLKEQLNIFSVLCLIIGVCSVLFCSSLYLRKKTRMTLVGTLIGFFVATIGVIYTMF